MMLAELHALIPLAVERTLDSLVGGLVLTGAAWAWLRVARRQNSASRFLFLFILLIGIAVLPIVGLSWLHPTSSSPDPHSLVTLPNHVAEYIFGLWFAVTAVALLRIAVGFAQLARLRRSCLAVNASEIDPRVAQALQNSPRAAVLCSSDRVGVPTALGLASPAMIVIPSWLMSQLSPEEMHHLVLHELAHLRRWDDWTNLAQRILTALLFFHPAIWWLQSRISLEREMACDECVLAETGNARAYARSLATMAERSFVRRSLALAQAAVSRLHDTTLRVSKILHGSKIPASPSRLRLLASATGLGVLTLMTAVLSPDLVSFAGPATPVIARAPAAVPVPEITKHSAPVASPQMVMASVQERPKVKPAMRKAEPETHFAHRVLRETPIVVPAKATVDPKANLAQPAVLVVWQETYENSDGMFVQRTFWRVVVLKQPISPKEQPQKSI
jgi:beta-lactamase regulating signal transducer with metallopeptidase domain